MLRLLSLILSLFCAAGLAAQDDLEARLDAVKEFKRYFKKAKEEALMVEADGTQRVLAALASLDDAAWEAIAEVVDAGLDRVLRDPAAQVRRQHDWLQTLGGDGAAQAAAVIRKVAA